MLVVTQKKNRSRKNGKKDRKMLQKSINNVVYAENMEKLMNKIDARLISI